MRKNMKKAASLAMAICMAAAVAGCGSSGSSSAGSTTAGGQESSAEAKADSGDKKYISIATSSSGGAFSCNVRYHQ